MKIESRRVMNFIGQAGAAAMRAFLATSKVRESVEDPDWHPHLAGRNRSFILALWHENMIVGAWWGRHFANWHTIASPSKDGEIFAGLGASIGRMKVIRGSSSQGGAQAIRQVVSAARACKVFRCAVTPDGPRGPRREMKSGIVYIASRLKLPIVCFGVACRDWRLGSWDRLSIPKPLGRVQIHLSAPVWPAANLSRDGIEDYSRFLQTELDRAQSRAEELLENPLATDRQRTVVNRAAA